MNFGDDFNISCRVLVPKDWSTDKCGDFFEKVSGKLLKKQRYKISERIRFTGMEIDLIADHIDTSQRAFVECKFLSDPFSANVIDLLLGKAVRNNVKIVYLFSTAPPGKEARGVLDELKTSTDSNIPKLAFVDPKTLVEMFVDVYNLQSLPDKIRSKGNISSGCLIIYPELNPFWVFEEHKEGIPSRAIIFPAIGELTVSKNKIYEIFDEAGIYQGLDLLLKSFIDDSNLETDFPQDTDEIVSQVTEAESLDDYRPCRPEYFIGRYTTQKEIWHFLDKVRKGNTSTRILALTGPSGFGKSSLILKLSDRFKNKKWKNKFYLYPVDARSAKGPLFVAKALRAGFESAINSGFIDIAQGTVNIDSTEGLIKGNIIQQILEELNKTKRVLVIFFDQFEELFTKEGLLPTFDSFKKLAFEVNAEQNNLVLGFSWRTGITFSDDNPAYHVWHELSDHRVCVNLEKFDSNESSQMVGQFEKAIKQKMVNPLRRRLLEQGRGMPWLLKKLCIHIYHEINKGVLQEELVIKRLNVSSLFNADLEPLTEKQNHCLKYIARNSPADMLDVFDKFDQETVNRLYNRRLIVRAGQRYAVYWDIFRDFLVEGVVPIIPWTYVPQVALSILIRSFLLLKEQGPLDTTELATSLEYAQKTVNNLLGDLQGFLLVDKDSDGKWIVKEEFINSDSDELASHLFSQLKEHVILHSLYKVLKPGQWVKISVFQEIIKNSYLLANLKSQTIDVYANRFLPFLRFAGAIEFENDKISRPVGEGRDFGVIEMASRKGRGCGVAGASFFCLSGPERVIKLAKILKKEGEVSKEVIKRDGYRNAASDLISLGLAFRRGGKLLPGKTIIQSEVEDLLAIIVEKAKNSPFLSEGIEFFQKDKNLSGFDLGNFISEKLNRGWSTGSKTRYGGAAKTWINFIDMQNLKSTQQ